MTYYELKGSCTITQFCHMPYPEKIDLSMLTLCPSVSVCPGHEVICRVEERIEASSRREAIDTSLTQFKGIRVGGEVLELEPTWLMHTLQVTILPEPRQGTTKRNRRTRETP